MAAEASHDPDGSEPSQDRRPRVPAQTISPTPSATEGKRLHKAVHQAPAMTRAGLLERTFTALFSGLVYAQIWEDPELDLRALDLQPTDRLIAIGSGGCNLLSYLTANPAEVIAVDLNPHHVHLIRLKQAGLRHMPTYQAFYRFFGNARDPRNPDLYRRHLRDHLTPETRAYWDGRDWTLRRRVGVFTRNIYRYGLLGRFITAGHIGGRLLGTRLEHLLEARDLAEQRAFFDGQIAPLFDHWLVRRITAMKASLFGLGIPPAQYDKLVRSGGGDMAVVLKRRLEKLTCDFPVADNYFVQQAFALRYPAGDAGPLPPYLQSRHFEDLRARADRVSVVNRSFTERLAEEPDGSMNAYVMLDAQDWMTDEQLNALWSEITRTAQPGARVLFRTADEPSLLPGRVSDALLDRWDYDAALSQTLTPLDRSAIYGGVHLYRFRG
jgi:S-adenosylmethionine-diacylglycerol 3-amino-3-carboxypropyl transferase